MGLYYSLHYSLYYIFIIFYSLYYLVKKNNMIKKNKANLNNLNKYDK